MWTERPSEGDLNFISEVSKNIEELTVWAKETSGFDDSSYGLIDNNCRHFCTQMAEFADVVAEYRQVAK